MPLAKASRAGSLRPFLSALALPPELSRPLVYLVPLLEAACGALLLAGLGPLPALGAAMLSAAFVVALVVARRADVMVGCHCFGPLDSGPTTYVSIVRAVILAGASGILLGLSVVDPTGSRLRPDSTTVCSFLLGVLAAAEYVAVFALAGRVHELVRHHRDVRARIAAVQEGRIAS